MGLSKELQDKLDPYLGKKKAAADAAIAKYGKPKISLEESKQIESAIFKQTYNSVGNAVNKKGNFENLHSATRSVLFSISYQYGLGGLQKHFPEVWSAAVKGDEHKIAKLLSNYKGEYQSRRNGEGAYLNEALKSK